MGLEPQYAIALFVVVPLMIMLVSSWWLHSKMNQASEKLIKAQQETINRLISREPVTYQETGQAPQKPSKEIYVAWGSEMVDLDKDT